jgi:hypothetical protein
MGPKIDKWLADEEASAAAAMDEQTEVQSRFQAEYHNVLSGAKQLLIC